MLSASHSILALTCMVLQACTPAAVTRDRLLQLQAGLSRTEVERRLQSPPAHEFTITDKADIVLGISFSIKPWHVVYLIVRNDRLEGLFDRSDVMTFTSQMHLPSPQSLIAHNGPDGLDRADLQTLFERWTEREEAYRRGEDNPVWPALLIVAPIAIPAMAVGAAMMPLALLAPEPSADDRAVDAFDIPLGLSAKDLERACGHPSSVIQGQQTTWLYRDKQSKRHGSRYGMVAVRLEDQRVVAVYSGDFVDQPPVDRSN